jgi:hypothetical protein
MPRDFQETAIFARNKKISGMGGVGLEYFNAPFRVWEKWEFSEAENLLMRSRRDMSLQF